MRFVLAEHLGCEVGVIREPAHVDSMVEGCVSGRTEGSGGV